MDQTTRILLRGACPSCMVPTRRSCPQAVARTCWQKRHQPPLPSGTASALACSSAGTVHAMVGRVLCSWLLAVPASSAYVSLTERNNCSKVSAGRSGAAF